MTLPWDSTYNNNLFGYNCLCRAHFNTRSAISTQLRIDDIDFVTFTYGFNRALRSTCTARNALVRNSVSQNNLLST
jgi:hypothetical protein